MGVGVWLFEGVLVGVGEGVLVDVGVVPLAVGVGVLLVEGVVETPPVPVGVLDVGVPVTGGVGVN